jgi:hypothetical protein
MKIFHLSVNFRIGFGIGFGIGMEHLSVLIG